eukprot:gene8846-11937_t
MSRKLIAADEALLVKTLQSTFPEGNVDPKRTFAALSVMKIEKKDRHLKALNDFSFFLDETNEEIVQSVLLLRRDCRESLESVDEYLELEYKKLVDDNFLIVLDEKGMDDILQRLKKVIANRCTVIDKFAQDVDGTELKRASVAGVELKKLVDKLVSIAHQLPDEIEHIVESESLELNTEIITNRKAYAAISADLKVMHVAEEAKALMKWENAKSLWRQLKHNEAVQEFRDHVASPEFTDPRDRQDYMKQVRSQQILRHNQVMSQLDRLFHLAIDNISSETVNDVQQQLSILNDNEITAIQECFNGLNQLRESLRVRGDQRVELLSQQLHRFAALRAEPNCAEFSQLLKDCTEKNTEMMEEYWKNASGLKMELKFVSNMMNGKDVIFNRTVSNVLERLEIVANSFGVRDRINAVMEHNAVEMMQKLLIKLRGATKSEIPLLLKSIVVEIEAHKNVEGLPIIFQSQLIEISQEMYKEIGEMDGKQSSMVTHNSKKSLIGSTSQLDETASRGSKTTKNTKSADSRRSMGTTSGTVSGVTIQIDSNLMKQWQRKLTLIYFGCDLPLNSQQTILQCIECMNQQKQCNDLVDEVLANESVAKLRHIDLNYVRTISSIVNYLEMQASSITQTAANVAEFFMLIAKQVELHRQTQKDLDNKSEDEIWDLSEEFRFEKEDLETEYELFCQRIRESTTSEEIRKHFDSVLDVLERIESSYRRYHSNGCFAADKYPLMLMQEFLHYLNATTKVFFLKPDVHAHPILKEYDRIFDSTIRLNQQFFNTKPAAAGFDRLYTSSDSYESSSVSEVWISPMWIVNQQQKPNGDQKTVSSPTKQGHVSTKSNEIPGLTASEEHYDNSASYAGKYCFLFELNKIINRFREDSPFSPQPEVSEADVEKKDKTPSKAAALLLKKIPHFDCPWITVDSELQLPLLTNHDQLDSMHIEDREVYETMIYKSFISIDVTNSGNDVDIAALVSTWTEEMHNSYKQCHAIYLKVAEKVKRESDSDYVLSHPPLDVNGNPWLSNLSISDDLILKWYGSVRDKLLIALEKESFIRILKAEKLSKSRKDEYTDRLEDQVRNHWPRRGRVETEIKQPREAELLGHKEKTWRLIQLIQQKVVESQTKLNSELLSGRIDCDNYINDMTSFRNQLSGDFRNLASLQGIDVKARGTTLAFQASSSSKIALLNKIVLEDLEGIVSYAKDFRKVCPPQTSGLKGGYSESEINEIQVLVDGQCEEILLIQKDWSDLVTELGEHQEKCSKCHEEFSVKYEKCVQDVSMSEGLGQKYGAPRRRAQEKIRTEVSRDDQSAGKIDELLANAEFLCSEYASSLQSQPLATLKGNSLDLPPPNSSLIYHDHENESTLNSSSSESDSAKFDLKVVASAWYLSRRIRLFLHQRAVYLDVFSTPVSFIDLPWISSSRTALSGFEEPEDLAMIPIKNNTFEQFCVEVDSVCRQETKDLYKTEGKLDVLGPSGIPDSLQAWLDESKEKLLGRHGHREKAWKRFWGQVTRWENLLSRNNIMKDDSILTSSSTLSLTTIPPVPIPSNIKQKFGVPSICLRNFVKSFVSFAKIDKKEKIRNFGKLLKIWNEVRDKHERLLRPRLGSPDVAEELNSLNLIELERSSDLVENVKKFRSLLVRTQVEHAKRFVEDVTVCFKGLMNLIDSTVRLEILQIPPDTEIPKKHMTLKRLRKAQRIREEVAAGQEDKSVSRVWPSIALSAMVDVIHLAESMVSDLGSIQNDFPPAVQVSDSSTTNQKGTKKGAPSSTIVDTTVTSNPSLVHPVWVDDITGKSQVRGLVSSAHRILLNDRDEAVACFYDYLNETVSEIREEYDLILKQEESWLERWNRQVQMLSKGNI